MGHRSLYAARIVAADDGYRIEITDLHGWLVYDHTVRTLNPADATLQADVRWLAKQSGCALRLIQQAVWDARLQHRHAA